MLIRYLEEECKNESPETSAGGFGCMGFSHGYGPGPGESEAIQLMRNAFDLGCTFYDAALMPLSRG